jgi:hypothetical protein
MDGVQKPNDSEYLVGFMVVTAVTVKIAVFGVQRRNIRRACAARRYKPE